MFTHNTQASYFIIPNRALWWGAEARGFYLGDIYLSLFNVYSDLFCGYFRANVWKVTWNRPRPPLLFKCLPTHHLPSSFGTLFNFYTWKK